MCITAFLINVYSVQYRESDSTKIIEGIVKKKKLVYINLYFSNQNTVFYYYF